MGLSRKAIALVFSPLLVSAPLTDVAVAQESSNQAWRQILPSEIAPFLGYYRQGDEFVRFTFKDGKLYATGTGQPEIELKTRRAGFFEGPSGRGNWQFQTGPAGRITAAILIHDGKSDILPRVDREEEARIQSEEQENLRRTMPHEGSEIRLRRQIQALSSGAPAYADLGSNLGRSIREGLPKVKTLLDQLGELRSLAFKQSLASGADVFWTSYEHGRLEWVISQPDHDGKIQHLAFRPI